MFQPGNNISIKVPAFKWAETVEFYEKRVGLDLINQSDDSVAFKFGERTLWIDRVATQSQADIWLELCTPSPDEALAQLGSPDRDGLHLIEDGNGRWTSDPAGVVLLLRDE